MMTRGTVKSDPIIDNVAAISCGIFAGTPILDLDYAEDSEADVDANFVMTGQKKLVEIQGSAERNPFSHDEFAQLSNLAEVGIQSLIAIQNAATQ